MPFTRERVWEWEYPAIVLSVLDGRTFLADIDLGFGVHMHSLVISEGIKVEGVGTPLGMSARKEAQKLLHDANVILRVRRLSVRNGKLTAMAEVAYSPYEPLRREQGSFEAAMLATGYASPRS